jgi:iron complex outermembrane receptor protein
MNRNVQMRLVAIVMLLIGINILKGAQVSTARGTIQGILVDADTKAPLIGANVTLKNTEWGTATDAEGKFSIRNIPVGNYTIKFMYKRIFIYGECDCITGIFCQHRV